MTNSLRLKCADIASLRGVSSLVYSMVDLLNREAIANQRRVLDLEANVRVLLASKKASEGKMESNEQGISNVEVVRTISADACRYMIGTGKMKYVRRLSLFGASDNWLPYLTSWLDFRSVGCLDTAIGHKQDRSTWLTCLRAMDTTAIDEHEHSCSSLRWVVERGIRVKRIKIRESSRNEIVPETFDGLYAPSLLSLDLHGCINVTDVVISSLSVGCSELQEIIVSECTRIGDAGIVAVADHCPKLCVINLSNCQNITDAGIIVLAHGCPQLSSIDLSSCHDITDAGMIALAQGCPQLSSINLYNCSNITDAGMIALAHGCPQLSSINLSECSNITDAGVIALAHGCPQLSSINLYNCINVTDAGMVALVQGCPLLRQVRLSYCRHVSLSSVLVLVKGCPDLSYDCLFSSMSGSYQ